MITLPPIALPPATNLNPNVPTAVLVASVPVTQAATPRPAQGPDREKHKLRDQPQRDRRDRQPSQKQRMAAQEQGRAMNTDFMT
ncbi:MAG: hypothetical protein ORN98_10510 [Alphaproteobacteria bacterium]|nr:hypothetical protein [Alphaproteobacteria bacterium]